MIDHSNCDHPRTKSGRAKCRKGVPSTTEGLNHGTTPRDRDKQCMNCGVEKVVAYGNDPITGQTLFVGDRCFYMIKRDPDSIVFLD